LFASLRSFLLMPISRFDARADAQVHLRYSIR